MRWTWQGITVLVVAAFVFVYAGYVVIKGPQPPADVPGSAATQADTPTLSPSPTTDSPESLKLPPRPRVVFLGDSWSSGYAAEPLTEGYAFVASRKLGWTMSVIPDGGGTSFDNIGYERYGTYAQRLGELKPDPRVDLLVIEGGLNDTGSPNLEDFEYNAAVEKTIKMARKKFPKAQFIVMGPLWPQDSNPTPEIATIDERLSFTTQELGLHYISPTQEQWFESDRQLHRLINEKATNHPNTAGHAYLARRFIQDVRKFERQ